jgi:hypothetical protein
MAGGTDGNLITYDASGDPAYVLTGATTEVLTSNGAGAAPTFQAAAAGGKILQVVSVPVPAITASTTSTTYVDIAGMTLDITPSATSSNVLIHITMNISGNASGVMGVVRLLRDGSPIFIGDQADSNRSRGMFTCRVYSNQFIPNYSATFYDTTISTTSAATYKLQWATETGYSILLNVANAGSDILKYGTTVSSITLVEIGV